MCGGREDAEDLVQETFLQAWRAWDRFEGRSEPGTWLWAIAARACQRRKRRRSGEPARVLSLDPVSSFGEGPVADLPAGEETPLDGEVRREALEHLQAGIVALPESHRLPLVLVDVLEMSVAEVASVLGLRPGTVRTRVHRARMKLRESLEKALPRKDAPPPEYSKAVCLDLLRARQEALDRGVPFPLAEKLTCERCRSVFASLGLGKDLCLDLARGNLPADVRRRVLEKMKN
jgi:RNA polymerase sigma-70 factor (ECF subfamily)